MEKIKVAVISDNPSFHTGYGVIAKALGDFGSDVFDISYIGLQHTGQTLDIKNSKGKAMPIYAGAITKPEDRGKVTRAINEIEPDVTLTLREPVTFSPNGFAQAFEIPPGKYKRISWIPAMSEYQPLFIIADMLKNTDRIFTFTKAAEYIYRNSGVPYNIMQTIPLGYDSSVFKPDGKTDYFDGKKPFTYVGTSNNNRERLGILLKSFAYYMHNYDPTAYIYIHNFDEGGIYNNLRLYAELLGIQGHILKPKALSGFNGVPASELADIYRSSTAVISQSPQDGFNLPFLEAMGCGTNAVGNNLPFYDWSDQIIKVRAEVSEETGLAFGQLSSTKDFAEGMHVAVTRQIDTDILKKTYDWKVIVRQVKKAIGDIL